MANGISGQPKLDFFQILDENGKCNESLMPKLAREQIRKMYEYMVLSRIFDDTAIKLQREGRLLTYASLKGQEAAQIGSAFAIKKDDWMFPSFREHGVQIVMGLPMHMLYQYWGGDERGMIIPEGMNMFTVSIPVSTHIPHAVGFAWAMKLRKERNAVIVYFGDGATSKGDFHEGMNFAGVFKTPCVFLCQNNQWAISVPRSRQSASETLAQKAFAYGFEGVLVDGNDVFAVYKVVNDAMEKARNGGGPTMIECYTYRMSDHTTADDATRYRTQQDLEIWKKKDPIARLKTYLMSKGWLTEEDDKKIWDDSYAKVLEESKKAESFPPTEPCENFDYTYTELPKNLSGQKKECAAGASEQKVE